VLSYTYSVFIWLQTQALLPVTQRCKKWRSRKSVRKYWLRRTSKSRFGL